MISIPWYWFGLGLSNSSQDTFLKPVGGRLCLLLTIFNLLWINYYDPIFIDYMRTSSYIIDSSNKSLSPVFPCILPFMD